jgi:ubiquinol-cytochrome c reductase iron-sulfur subunit
VTAAKRPDAEGREQRAERIVLVSFGFSFLAGIALLGLYVAGGQTQIEGLLLTACLGGLGVGIVIWGQELMPTRIHIEERHSLARPDEVERLTELTLEETGFSRRKLLIRALLGAFAGLGAALAIPVFSLGPAPGRELFETSWRGGRRLSVDGGSLRREDLPLDGVLTVFPDGDTSDPNAATLLIRVDPSLLELEGDAAGWAPEGYVAYSKICTHAGCPVGLYRASQHTLICPCHQSEFDVLHGARPVNGPAARPLPQLPIAIQPDGTFMALGDFPEPVGPSFWNMNR